MLNSIIQGISIRLNELFGDDYRIYVDEVKQGHKSPCFFILPLLSEQSDKLGVRALREYPFDIHYFPAKLSNVDIYDVAEKMILGLDYISPTNNSLVQIKSKRYEVVDGVLHFMCRCSFYVIKPKTSEITMQDLEYRRKGV